ncbi:hypothetical protein ABW19_dt0201713 [Dactylella cylindrospora]|nr:hypothetical protein ABW19_dt0201713 [Dactylella cylindrospora]
MSPSIFLTAAIRAKLPKRTSASISLRDACFFIEAFMNGSQRCYATHSANASPENSNQPASHRPFNSRQTLLHRTYISLLRSTPLLVLFQHNNVKGNELVAIRRDLKNVMANVDAQVAASRPPPEPSADGIVAPPPSPVGEQVRLTVLNTEVFSAALRVAEYLPAGVEVPTSSGPKAYNLTARLKKKHPLAPLMVGPIGAVEFPVVSPPHLLAVLNLLFPERMAFRKGTDPAFISGVGKLLLLGAKVDKIGGQTIDTDTVKHICTLGDIDTLRGQLLGLIQSPSAGLVATLQSPSKGLWVMMEGRRKMLDPESQKGSEEGSTDTPPS